MSNLIQLNREEGSHFYKPDGTPCHEVPKKKGGGMRKTNIRDAAELGLLPSPTTVLKAAAKPGLINWMIGNACLAVLTSPRKDGESDDRFVQRVLKEKEEQNEERNAAAELGTAVHARIAEILTNG